MANFSFIDRVEDVQNGSLTAFFTLKGSEEFLQDHFEHFPVMPGVLLLECLKQASAKVLGAPARLVQAENVKFGYFVKPGTTLKISTKRISQEGQRSVFEGRIEPADPAVRGKALSATITLEPV